MLVVVSLVLGLFGFSRLQTDLFPEVEFPVVSVSTVYPGAGPEEIETQVTDRLEEAVSTLAGIDVLRSFSQENVSIVIVQFDLGVDPGPGGDRRARPHRDGARPAAGGGRGADRPEVRHRRAADHGPGALGPAGHRRALRAGGPGAARALLARGRRGRRSDRRRPRARGRGAGLAGAAAGLRRDAARDRQPDPAENVSVPSGRITEARRRRAGARGRRVPLGRGDRGAAPLPGRRPGGAPRRHRHRARRASRTLNQVARFNGEPAVSISIQKRSDANPVNTAAGVRAEIERISASCRRAPRSPSCATRASSSRIRSTTCSSTC
jgi:hydrophobic/amphiphilic exporter-1 (mainly G- bacteria), HAE1 family